MIVIRMMALMLLCTEAAALGLVKAEPDDPAPLLRALLKPIPSDGFQAKPAAELGRRTAAATAVAGLFALPLAAPAYNYGKNGGFTGYKSRGYGDMEAPSSAEPEDKKRMMPDGKGGFIERKEEVKAVSTRVVEKVLDGYDRLPAAPAPAPAPRAAASTQSSSSAPKSFEELLANSILQKEDLLGRPLDAAERADMESKLKALLR
jgi:hypothetical protein